MAGWARPTPGQPWVIARRLIALFAVVVIVGALSWSPPAFGAGAAPASFAELAERLSPAVVNVATSQKVTGTGRVEVPVPQFPPGSPFEDFFKEFFDRQQGDGEQAPQTRRVTSLGSGFIIDPSGVIVTNNHVIAEADEITVTLNDNRQFEAEIVGRDPKTDLALLRVKTSSPLPSVKFGESSSARVGDWVIAIGNPYGLGGTVTAGIISARGRNINAGPYDDFLQTDASINRGNSGGPMFNTDGEVIGINTAIFSPSGGSVGIGFAIPSSLAEPVIDQLMKYGRTRRGWLGVRIQTVTEEIAESLGLEEARGALVAGVSEEGPAEEGGIAAGDVILTFDGKPIDEMRELPRIVAETEIGRKVEVVVWRKGVQRTVFIAIAELDESEAQLAAIGPDAQTEQTESIVALGMDLAPLTPEARERFGIGVEVEGVLVTGVEDDSPASEKGLSQGDVIAEVNQEEVVTPAQVRTKVREAHEAERRSVLLRVYRDDTFLYVVVRIAES